jgi:two-component sensor histidine kinase
MRKLCGISGDAAVTFDLFISHVRSEDRGRTRSALLRTFNDGEPRQIECRLETSSAGMDRWIALSGRPCPFGGGANMHMFGTARDISPRKVSDAQRELAERELEHRLQNVFTVVTAIVSLSEPLSSTPHELALSLRTRIGAIARAHALLRKARSGKPLELRQIIEGELIPFTDLSSVSIDGPSVRLDGAQAVAMNAIMHELTTNALKHGALAHGGGRVSIDWTIETSMSTDCLVLRWKELGTLPLAAPKSGGLGLKVLKLSARSNLGGDILLEFNSAGLLATLVAPLSPLVRVRAFDSDQGGGY